jgi:hypothetical protein
MSVYETDQDAVGRRHQRVLNTLLPEIRGHLADPKIRPKGHWCGVHHIFDMALRIGVQQLGCDESQHDAMSIYDDQRLDVTRAETFPHLPHVLLGTRRRNFPRCDIGDSRDTGVFAVARQSSSEPVSFSRLISVNGEPEAFEPRRGPRAQVSLIVVAVRNDGAARVQPLGGRSIECLERDVDRTRDVLGLVFFGPENLNELSAVSNELLDAMTVDHRRHVYLLTAAASACRRRRS